LVDDWHLANASSIVALATQQQAQQPHGGEHSAATLDSNTTPAAWQHPLSGRYKCNIGAAFSSSLNRTGIGICVRDSDGTFVLAKVISFPCIYSVDVGEALGLHSVMQWLSDMQFDNVDFETDSKITRDAFHSTQEDISEFGCSISFCRSLFSSFFTNSRVDFARRQENVVAHVLAREATFLASPVVYF